MLIDRVKCSKLTHLKHFTLNAAKNFINSFPNTNTVNWSLEGQKSLWERHCPSLLSLKSAYGCMYIHTYVAKYVFIIIKMSCIQLSQCLHMYMHTNCYLSTYVHMYIKHKLLSLHICMIDRMVHAIKWTMQITNLHIRMYGWDCSWH